MIATELRVGNLLNYCGNTVTVMEILRNNRVELGYFTDSIGFVRSLNDENIKPILLTEEWLKKFEFNVGNHKEFNKWTDEYENISLFVDEFYYGIAVNSIEVWTISRKLYVHQLQNLYFSLTNVELKIEL